MIIDNGFKKGILISSSYKFLLKLFILFLVIFLDISCSKSEISEIDRQRISISGSGSSVDNYHVWKLESAIRNDTVLVLNNFQKQYTKTFSSNKDYKDSDLNNGKWDISVINKLSQFTNILNKWDTVNYEILLVDKLKLKIKLVRGKENIIYTFSNAN